MQKKSDPWNSVKFITVLQEITVSIRKQLKQRPNKDILRCCTQFDQCVKAVGQLDIFGTSVFAKCQNDYVYRRISLSTKY